MSSSLRVDVVVEGETFEAVGQGIARVLHGCDVDMSTVIVETTISDDDTICTHVLFMLDPDNHKE
jgi:hypothetical protein